MKVPREEDVKYIVKVPITLIILIGFPKIFNLSKYCQFVLACYIVALRVSVTPVTTIHVIRINAFLVRYCFSPCQKLV